MKYVITSTNEARIGGGYHADLKEGLGGRVIAAGHCELLETGEYRVWGSSIGYSIQSKPEDAKKLKEILNGI